MRCSIDLRTMRTVVYPPMASDAPPGPSCVQLYTCSPLYAFGRYTDATRFVSCDAKSGVRTLMLCYHSRSKQRTDQMVLNNTSTYAQIFSRKKYFPNFFLTPKKWKKKVFRAKNLKSTKTLWSVLCLLLLWSHHIHGSTNPWIHL